MLGQRGDVGRHARDVMLSLLLRRLVDAVRPGEEAQHAAGADRRLP